MKNLNIPKILKRVQKNYVTLRKKWGCKDIKQSPMVAAWQPRKQRFKGCNGKCTLDIPSLTGWSYNWWQVIKIINGQLVFNNYSYSNTTTVHQWMLKDWLKELGVSIDFVIHCPSGLQSPLWAESSLSHYADNIGYLEALKVYGTKIKNEERTAQVKELKLSVSRVAKLGKIPKSKVASILTLGMEYGVKRVARERQEKIDKKIEIVTNKLLGVA